MIDRSMKENRNFGVKPHSMSQVTERRSDFPS